MSSRGYHTGVIGLGTMGRNLACNLADHKYMVAGFDLDAEKVSSFNAIEKPQGLKGFTDIKDFIAAMEKPRCIMLLVPAGKAIDSVIDELSPLLEKGDIIMDCGNSHFADTNRRQEQLNKSGLHFMGVGVSGGEEGARFGPSIMAGGDNAAYGLVEKMLTAIAAKAGDSSCAGWMGEGSAGHYVKMVHNGIEYGLMQLIAESYLLLKKAAGLNNEELHDVFTQWNKGKLQSFLVEITAEIFNRKDDLSGNYLIDMILDSGQQKGTGRWTSEQAMELDVPIPTIDMAVVMRNLSTYRQERKTGEEQLKLPQGEIEINKKELVQQVEEALYFGMICTYAQGTSLLAAAGNKYNYKLQLPLIASVWKGGCIIRAALLENIYRAFNKNSALQNLLFDEYFATELKNAASATRKVVAAAANSGLPVPALSASLAYADAFSCGWLPLNLVQAQRDFFGAHTYKRTDRDGIFHTNWT